MIGVLRQKGVGRSGALASGGTTNKNSLAWYIVEIVNTVSDTRVAERPLRSFRYTQRAGTAAACESSGALRSAVIQSDFTVD